MGWAGVSRCGRGVRNGWFNQKDPGQPRPVGGGTNWVEAGRVEKGTPLPSPREEHPKRERNKCPEKEKYLTCTLTVIATLTVLMANNYWAYRVPGTVLSTYAHYLISFSNHAQGFTDEKTEPTEVGRHASSHIGFRFHSWDLSPGPRPRF